MSEKSLANYIISNYGSNSIIKSDITPSNKSIYHIKKDILIDNISDNAFHKYISDNYEKKDYIPLQDFIDFAITKGNTKSTKGKYQEYMSFIFAYYNIKFQGSIINFDILPDNIIPLRLEYTITWSIYNMVYEDEFLSKYINTLLKPSYQKYINKEDNRYYDMLFENVDIIIEVQEDSYAHTESVNDSLKESLVKVRNKRIFYVNMNEFNKDQNLYLIDTLDKIRIMLLQGLLTKSIDIRQEYLFYEFKNRISIEILNLENKIKKSSKLEIEGYKQRIKNLNIIDNDESDRIIIEKVFKWKQDAIISNNKHVITINEVEKLLRIDTKENKLLLIEEIYENGNYEKRNKEIILDWKGVIEIIMMTSLCNNNIKMVLLNYLTNVEELFETIIQYIQEHYEACLQFSENNMNLLDKHYQDRIKKGYYDKISKLEVKLKVQEELNTILINKSKEIISATTKIYKSLEKKVASKKETGTFDELTKSFNDLKKLYETNKHKILTIQNIEDESIFKEIPDFPVIYNSNYTSRIDSELFDAICHEWNIPQLTIKKCYNNFCFLFSSGRSNNIPFVSIRYDKYKRYGTCLIPSYIMSDSLLITDFKKILCSKSSELEMMYNRIALIKPDNNSPDVINKKLDDDDTTSDISSNTEIDDKLNIETESIKSYEASEEDDF